MRPAAILRLGERIADRVGQLRAIAAAKLVDRQPLQIARFAILRGEASADRDRLGNRGAGGEARQDCGTLHGASACDEADHDISPRNVESTGRR